ncbi:MAG: alpha/beta fold hydrolase [Myxococcota bacterium]
MTSPPSEPPGEGLEPTAAEAAFARYPGARRADRRRDVDAHGVRIAVHEWGDPQARPLLLAHGGFDFAGTFSVFAPLLADAGWRVVGWDQRGHGDSGHPELYSWDADMRDALAVLDSTTREPVPLVGHSKGGSVLTNLAHTIPHRVSRVVNLDGIPSRKRAPDVADHERTRLLAEELSGWLAHRHRSGEARRKPGHLEDLARRRARMNPRLQHDWLCFLVTLGARKDADGWRWKIDPALRFGGFGPWRPDWALRQLPGLPAPFLGVLAGVWETMGWETRAEDVEPHLPRASRVHVLEDTGHFVHIERPREVADLVLEFLA